MSLETPNTGPITADDIIQAIGISLTPEEIEKEKKHGYLTNAVEDLNQDSDALQFYRAVLLNGDKSYLKESTKKRAETIKEFVHPSLLKSLKSKGYSAIKEVIKRRQRVAEFLAFTQNLKPVRHDSNLSIQEFKSPSTLGINRGAGMYDLPVMANHYVYATSDKIAHPMGNVQAVDIMAQYEENLGKPTTELAKSAGYRYLDETDIADRAEMVMMDIADVAICTIRLERSSIITYLNNVFDYTGGKEILAYYLAYVFDDVMEAQRFLTENCDREAAEAWQKDYAYGEGGEPDSGDLGSHFHYRDPNGKWVGFKEDTTGWLRKVQRKMREVFDATGILPPLELEIRVRDYAKIKEGC